MSNFNTIHNSFRLNGNSFSSQKELLVFAKQLSLSTYTFLKEWFNNTDFIAVHTSGSTGTPKSINIRKEQMISSANATGDYFNLPNNTSALLCLSTEFIAGKMMLVRALVLGWQIDIIEPTSDPLSGMSKPYDFCAMMPMQLQNSLKNLDLIKKIIVGGAKVSNSLQQKLKDLKTEVYATYGMTETVTHIAAMKLNNGLSISSESEKSKPYYKVFPNVKISKDTRGCLVIDAPTISNEQVKTNDLVEIISDTEFKWLGRYDSIINSGGIKISPELIEEKLEHVIKQRFFAAGIPDTILGEKLIIVIESANIEDNLLYKIKEVKALSKFEIPKEMYAVPVFARTGTKKIDRKKILTNLNLLKFDR